MKRYDYKLLMKKKDRKRLLNRAAGLTIATTIALGTPVATNVLNLVDKESVIGTSVAYAQTQNLSEFADYSFRDSFAHWSYYGFTEHDLGVHMNILADDSHEDLIFTIKIPEEFAHYMNNEEYLSHTLRYSSISGSFLDENGERVSSVDLDQSDYINFNFNENMFEFHLSDLMNDNNVRLNDDFRSLLFTLSFTTEPLPLGDHAFPMALTEGGVDPTTVSDAFVYNYKVGTDYFEDEEYYGDEAPTTPEEPGEDEGEEPSTPEEPGEDEGEEPTTPEEPGEDEDEEPADPEEPGEDEGEEPVDPEEPGEDEGEEPTTPEEPGEDEDEEPADPEEPGEDEGEEPTTPEEPGEDEGEEPTTPEEDGGDDSSNPNDSVDEGEDDSSDKDDSVNEDLTDQKFKFDETIAVSPNQLIQIEGTSISVQLPGDLPKGTNLTITKSSDDHAVGDVVDIDLQLPEGQEDYEGQYILTLGINDDFIDEELAIFYFNENSGEWEYVEGEVDYDNQTISTTVNHFSKYGVFAVDSGDSEGTDVDEESSKDDVNEDAVVTTTSVDDNNNGDGEKLPDTATSTFNWLLGGFVALLAGAAGLFTNRKRKMLNK